MNGIGLGKPMSVNKFTAVIAALLLLVGCQNVTTVTQTPTDKIDAQQTASRQPTPAAKPPVKPFPRETLYALLAAEIAGMRGELDLALNNYLQQAEATRDISIVNRALHIATYINNSEAKRRTASLWLELEPDNLEARRTLAIELARSGELLDALPHAIFCLEQDDAEPLFTLTVLANRKNHEVRRTLLAQYPRLETQHPQRTEILLSKAMLLRQQKAFSEALIEVEKALALKAASETGQSLKAQLLHQTGDKGSAMASLEQAIALLPGSKRLRVQQVRFILAAGDLPEAKNLLETLTGEYPQDADLKLALAAVLSRLDQRSEARAIYRELTRNRNIAPNAYFQLGLLAEEEGDVEQALLNFRRVRSGTSIIPAAARVARLLTQHNQLESARLYLGKLRTEMPQQAAGLFQVESELLLEFQQNMDAYQVLSSALAAFPQNISLLYTRSLVGERLQEYAQAEKDLRSILALDENNAMALNALGYTLTLHTTRYQEAHRLIVRALELNPGDPATTDSLGWVLFHMGQHQEALVHLRKAFAEMPDPEVAAHLGEVLWTTGAREEARGIWQKTLEENPENPLILETIERLGAGE